MSLHVNLFVCNKCENIDRFYRWLMIINFFFDNLATVSLFSYGYAIYFLNSSCAWHGMSKENGSESLFKYFSKEKNQPYSKKRNRFPRNLISPLQFHLENSLQLRMARTETILLLRLLQTPESSSVSNDNDISISSRSSLTKAGDKLQLVGFYRFNSASLVSCSQQCLRNQ